MNVISFVLFTSVILLSLYSLHWRIFVEAITQGNESQGNDVRLGMTINDCKAAGFAEGLVCSDCELAAKYVPSAEFYNSCMGCCQEVEAVSPRAQMRYPKAILEMCNCKLRAFPQMEPFVRGKMKNKFPRLQHEHIPGAPPRLKLLNEQGKIAEELNIEKWDTDTVAAFLSEKLIQNESS